MKARRRRQGRQDERRRAGLVSRLRTVRLPVLLVSAFAGVVLVTSMPVAALLTQRHQLSATTAALARASAADGVLSHQAQALGQGGTLSGLARSDYGLVPAGQKAYVILPPAGSSSSVVSGSGHVPLNGPPVVPGSAESQALLGLGPAPSTGAKNSPGRASRSTGRSATASGSSPESFWSRVVRGLEFWR